MAGAYGIAGSIIGAGASFGLAAYNNRLAEQRAADDRRSNYIYGEMAANNADLRTRHLYESYYSPEALLKQYEEAGLSPSMMFGGTPGQGGMSGSQGSGGNGYQTPIFGVNGLEAAQIAKTIAETDKIKEETRTEAGENERGNSEIKEVLAKAGLEDAQTAFVEAETIGQNITNEFSAQSLKWNVGKARAECRKLENEANFVYWETRNSELEFNFNSETYETRKEQLTNEVLKTTSEMLLNYSKKKLTEQETKNAENFIKQKWYELNAIYENLELKEREINNQVYQWKEEFKQGIRQYLTNEMRGAFTMFTDYLQGQGQMLIQGAAVLRGKGK